MKKLCTYIRQQWRFYWFDALALAIGLAVCVAVAYWMFG